MLRLLVLTALCYGVTAETYADADHIHQDILNNSNPYLRPSLNQSESVPLEVKFNRIRIMDLDVVNAVLTTKFWINLQWRNQMARWTTNDEPPDVILLPKHKIWVPDFHVINSDGLEYDDDQMDVVTIKNTGVALQELKFTSKTSCRVSVEKFPLDEQTCNITLGSDFYRLDSLNVTRTDQADDVVSAKSEWDVLHTSVSLTVLQKEDRSDTRQIVTVSISLKRQSLFYVLNLLLPLIIISTISPFVFLVRSDSGEKVSIAVTLFLSFAVFLSLLQNMLPRTSKGTSMISIYVSLQLVLSGIYLACCISIQRINQMTEHNAFTKFVVRDSRTKVQDLQGDASVTVASLGHVASKLDRVGYVVFSAISYTLTAATMVYVAI